MKDETYILGGTLVRRAGAAHKPRAIGLGDAVAAVATPIARVLRLPCIDPATKQLRPESGCAKRKAALNASVPSLQPAKLIQQITNPGET